MAADAAAIRAVNVRAFGREQEANIVDALRSQGASVLSLVAIMDGAIVGHILYSPVTIGEVIGAGLAPMAVLPHYQRRGIGSRLVIAGNDSLRQAGYPFIVVLGHPSFYPRFGFRPGRENGMSCEWHVPDEVFMTIILDQQRMQTVRGLARYRPEFSEIE